MDNWFTEVKSQSEPDALCFLIGNQKDREQEREVGLDKAEKFQQIKSMNYFAETSAKTGDNVQETFINVGKMLYQKHIKKILTSGRGAGARRGGERLRPRADDSAKKGGCACKKN